jgi:hypothetical protein
MKILCVSDTHRDLSNFNKVLELEEDFDLLLHAGDNIDDIDSIQDSAFNAVIVKGNGDRQKEGNWDEVINISDKKILLTHGHRYGVKYGLNKLAYKAMELEVDIVVFGHTHRSFKLEEDGILFLNPGSLNYPRDGSFSYGVIKIKEGKVRAEIKDI